MLLLHLMLISLGQLSCPAINLTCCMCYLMTTSLFQSITTRLYSNQSMHSRILFSFVYMLVILICLPLIQIFNPNTVSGAICLYFMVFKLAVMNSVYSHCQLQVFVELTKGSNKQMMYKLTAFKSMLIIAALSLLYALIYACQFQEFFAIKRDRILFMYFGFLGLYVMFYVLFIKWIQQNCTYSAIMRSKRQGYSIQFIDSIFSFSYLEYQNMQSLSPSQTNSLEPLKENYKIKLELDSISELNDKGQQQEEHINFKMLMDQKEYNKVYSKFVITYICVFFQTLNTVFFLIPWFLCDPMFPTILTYKDSIFDISIKIILFTISNGLGLLMQKKLKRLDDCILVIITLFKLLVLTPIHLYLCLHCKDERNNCTTLKNITIPLVYSISYMLYIYSMDFSKIFANKSRTEFIKADHKRKIGKMIHYCGTVGLFIGGVGCFNFLQQ